MHDKVLGFLGKRELRIRRVVTERHDRLLVHSENFRIELHSLAAIPVKVDIRFDGHCYSSLSKGWIGDVPISF
ncbi:hypothetical protein D3C71_1680850 [compost metagenome]